MDQNFLRDVAAGCLVAAKACTDTVAKEKFYEIAEHLLRQASPVDTRLSRYGDASIVEPPALSEM